MALFLWWIWDIYDDVYTLLQPYEVYQKDFHSFKHSLLPSSVMFLLLSLIKYLCGRWQSPSYPAPARSIIYTDTLSITKPKYVAKETYNKLI
jgi:hypothetical protein